MAEIRNLRALIIAPEESRYLDDLRREYPSIRLESYDETKNPGQFDLTILIIQADRGISQSEISAFNRARESQIPSMVLVASLMPTPTLISSESLTSSQAAIHGDDRWDFDDVVMLINRTLEPSITPYLVLHDPAGAPIGLYDLARELVLDYSSGSVHEELPDDELKELVSEFKREFDEEGFDLADFTSGLRTVALPFVPERSIGLAELDHFLTMLRQVQT